MRSPDKLQFLQWCRDEHGPCSRNHPDCEIMEAIVKYDNRELTWNELFETVKDVDDGWEESFFSIYSDSEET